MQHWRGTQGLLDLLNEIAKETCGHACSPGCAYRICISHVLVLDSTTLESYSPEPCRQLPPTVFQSSM